MKKITALLALCCLTPFLVSAETALRISDSISVSDDQVVNGDFYGATGLAGPISLSGLIEGDALVVANTVTANGSIDGDLFSVSGSSQIHASVTDDVRVISGETTIAEYVGGDVFVLTGRLKVLSTAEIVGNVFFYGGEGELNGSIGGSVYGTSESLRIDGRVDGDVDVVVGRSLVIGGRADIGGDITYTSSRELVRAQDAVVVGDIIATTDLESPISPRAALIPFLMFAFLTLVAYILGRKQLHHLVAIDAQAFTRNGLIGLAAFLFLPPLILLLLISVIGTIVGGLLLVSVLTLYLVAFAYLAIFVGAQLNKLLFKNASATLFSTLGGIAVVELVSLVPLVGPAAILAAFCVVLGLLLRTIYHWVV